MGDNQIQNVNECLSVEYSPLIFVTSAALGAFAGRVCHRVTGFANKNQCSLIGALWFVAMSNFTLGAICLLPKKLESNAEYIQRTTFDLMMLSFTVAFAAIPVLTIGMKSLEEEKKETLSHHFRQSK